MRSAENTEEIQKEQEEDAQPGTFILSVHHSLSFAIMVHKPGNPVNYLMNIPSLTDLQIFQLSLLWVVFFFILHHGYSTRLFVNV